MKTSPSHTWVCKHLNDNIKQGNLITILKLSKHAHADTKITQVFTHMLKGKLFAPFIIMLGWIYKIVQKQGTRRHESAQKTTRPLKDGGKENNKNTHIRCICEWNKRFLAHQQYGQ